jgi:zinc/manganese transport system ATP-binding protein
MGMIQPLEGYVHVDNCKISEIGFLPQQTQLDASFPISVLDTVCSGFWRTSGLFGGIKLDKIERAINALNDVGLSGFENCPAVALSRGQFQRVLFARLMVQEAQSFFWMSPLQQLMIKHALIY